MHPLGRSPFALPVCAAVALPAGGSPVKVITGQFDLPTGAVVSVGKKR